MISKFAMGVVVSAGLAFAVSASAQTAPPATPGADGFPFCSAKVKDRCIQKSDLKREGKSTAKAAG
jgi:hypothetical protein